mmetsp:Transcript_35106/g.34139  ORF Transcript_35106/g.34139 Transcript_35106/m.34139 type:complete len:172 (+) Transcript_35106:92-607(+)
MSFEAGKLKKYEDDIFHDKFRSHCKIINSFCLMGRFLILAHNRTVSLYNVTEQKGNRWFAHFDIGEEIKKIFRQKNEKGDFALLILDVKGRFKVMYQDKSVPEKPWIINDNPPFELEGKLVSFAQDKEDNQWTIFLTRTPSNSMPILKVLHQAKMYDITGSFEDLEVDDNF